MKKSVRKIITTIIALAILSLALVGCSGDQTVQNTPSVKPQASHRPYEDLKGENFRILYTRVLPGKGAEPFANKGRTGTLMKERIDQIQAGYNCTIEYVGDGTDEGWKMLHLLTLAGVPSADVAFLAYPHIVDSFVVQGGGALYTVLNDYADELEINNAEVWDQAVTDNLYTIDGLTMAVQPKTRGAELVDWGAITFFNKSMLEREGLWSKYNLYEMQKNKTWTWEVMDEIGRKVSKDRDGDGKIDQFGMIYDPHAYVGFCASNKADDSDPGFYGLTNAGEPKFFGREQSRLNVLDSFAKWGDKGNRWLKAIELGQQPHEGAQREFANGKYAFIVELGSTLRTFKDMKMQDTIGAVAMPIGPDNIAKDYNIGRIWYQPWGIPKGIDDSKTVESNITKTRGAALIMRDLCAPLLSEEETIIETESMLTDLIGNEEGIIDTYTMLGDPDRVVNMTESPFVYTWVGPIASYHGSFPSIIKGEITAHNLNAEYGDSIQTEMNLYWNKVVAGAANQNKIRAEGA